LSETYVITKFKEIFTPFVFTLADGVASNPVPWRVLNEVAEKTKVAKRGTGDLGSGSSFEEDCDHVVDSPAPNALVSDRATDLLRTRVRRLNSELERSFGKPPDGRSWLVSVKGTGMRLNGSIRWSVNEDLKKLLKRSSVYTHNTDPTILAEVQSGYEQKSQARKKAHRSNTEGEEPSAT
jgi:hypothetical protein